MKPVEEHRKTVEKKVNLLHNPSIHPARLAGQLHSVSAGSAASLESCRRAVHCCCSLPERSSAIPAISRFQPVCPDFKSPQSGLRMAPISPWFGRRKTHFSVFQDSLTQTIKLSQQNVQAH
jgi:hypothetical protein